MRHSLENIEKKLDLKVPDGYFDKLPDRIQARIEAEKTSKQVFWQPAVRYAIAASVLLLITFSVITNMSKPSAESLLAEVSDEAVLAYLESTEVSEYEIALMIDDGADDFQKTEMDFLEMMDLEEESIDYLLLEYDLEDKMLEI